MKTNRPMLSVFAVMLVAAVGCPLHAQITEPSNNKVVFRYRSFSGTIPSWVSPLTSLGGISHASGSTDIVSTDRGAGFEGVIATDFDGTTEFVQGASTITSVDSAGDDSLAIEAWFKTDSVTGTRTLFSNTESNRGFSLKLSSGRLQGEVRLRNGSATENQIVPQEAAYPNLSAGVWYYAVFHVRRTSTNYELRLYLDGVRVAFLTASHYDGVYQSVEKPMVGAEPNAGTGGSSFFDGQIYAVAVSNHDIYLDNYVKMKVARDGSRYFGMPSYHDYLSTTASPDFRIQATISDYSGSGGDLDLVDPANRIQLPFLNDGYIPQGLGYDPTSQNFYVSYYWKDNDGATGSLTSNSDKISIVAEIHRPTNTMKRVFRLYRPNGEANYGHVGGLEYHAGSLYVAYGTSVYRYPLASAPNPGYVFHAQTFANPRGDQNPLTVVTTYPFNATQLQGNAAHSTLHIQTDTNGDKILWTTEYNTGSNRKLLGFRINTDGSVATAAAVYSFNLPVTAVNGMCCYSMTATECYFYVVTGGVWKRLRYLKSSPTVQSTTNVFVGPGGTEDFTMVGTQIWTTNESGARYYQKRTDGAPWDNMYPFLFGMSL